MLEELLMARYVFFCIHNLWARIAFIFLFLIIFLEYYHVTNDFKITSLLSEQGDEFSNFLKIKDLGDWTDL